MSKETTIVIADDHAIVRKGLRETIEEDGGFTVVAEVGTGSDALEAIERLAPSVAILDIDMPGMNGFEVARKMRSGNLATDIVFLTMHRDEDLFNEAIDLGAIGYVLKDSALSDIVECLRAVAARSHFTSHSLTSYLINRSRRAAGLTEKQASIGDLTPSERTVLKLIAENASSREIAEKLFISLRTVEKHRENICRKLGLQGSHSLFKFAVLHKSQLL